MKDSAFFEDLNKLVNIEPPQEEDEFTTRWFSIRYGRNWSNTRIFLERQVKEGKMTVRRHVRLTWESEKAIKYADVYKLHERKVKKVKG